MKNLSSTFSLILLIGMSSSLFRCSTPQGNASTASDSIAMHALHELRTNLATQSKWDKVHAAEYLIWLGHPEDVYETYKDEETRFGQESPYRIGIWRVLAQTARTSEERQLYIERILEAFKDTGGADRLHASETLTKLKESLHDHAADAAREVLAGDKTPLYVYTLAGASLGESPAEQDNFDKLVSLTIDKNTPDQLQMQGAYALRHIGGLSDSSWTSLANTALQEPNESVARVYLLSSAFVTAPADQVAGETFSALHQELLHHRDAPSKGARAEMAGALALRGTEEDLPALHSLLFNENPLNSGGLTSREEIIASPENADVRSAAAYAMLSILSAKSPRP